MHDAAVAVVFLVMLLLPCCIAMNSDTSEPTN